MTKNAHCLLFDNYVPIGNKIWYLYFINGYFTYKESAHPPGNGFSGALESRFLVPKNEA